jgi:hypothetical protein
MFVNMPRYNFFLTEPKIELFPKLDKLVDKMISNTNYWPQIKDYHKILMELKTEGKF